MTEKPPFSRQKRLVPSTDFAWNDPRHKTCSLFHTPDVFREVFRELFSTFNQNLILFRENNRLDEVKFRSNFDLIDTRCPIFFEPVFETRFYL